MHWLPLVIVLSSGAVDQAAYHPGTFRALEASFASEHPEAQRSAGEPRDMEVIHPLEKVRVRVTLTGRIRPLQGFKQTATLSWCRHNFPGAVELLKREVEVVEGGVKRWLPIQDQLIDFLAREVPQGGTMDVFAVWFGAANGEHIYIVNDFFALAGGDSSPKP
jgi:hypothetical protein